VPAAGVGGTQQQLISSAPTVPSAKPTGADRFDDQKRDVLVIIKPYRVRSRVALRRASALSSV
jgi:hypothetical protein